MEMDPVPGLRDRELGAAATATSSLQPDLGTLRRDPVARGDGARPLRRRLARRHAGRAVAAAGAEARRSSGRARARASRRCSARSSSSTSSRETYAEAHAKHYRDLTPSVPYILDYHILATTYDEPFIRQIRNGMQGAGIPVESSKGEAWPGQHEINFRYADAVTMADNHDDLQERRQGDRAPERLLDHLHGEARPHVDRQLVPRPLEPLARRRERVRRRVATSSSSTSPGRSPACSELAIFLAPTINSYKRFAAGSWAPTTLAWGHDNRTCGFRIVGHGAVAARGDADPRRATSNPYLALRRAARRRPATGSRTSSSCRRRSRGTRTSRTPSASRTRCARRSTRSRRGRWRARRSATTSSTTT